MAAMMHLRLRSATAAGRRTPVGGFRTRQERLAPGTATPRAWFGAEANDAELRADVRMLGGALGSIIKEHRPSTYDTVETMRNLAKTRRNEDTDSSSPLDPLVDFTKGLESDELGHTARAFTHFLALANVAEEQHRTRRIRAREATNDLTQTVGSTVESLLAAHDSGSSTEAAASREQVYDALCSQTVEIVLTAHPTEVNRRTLLSKHRNIADGLAALDLGGLTDREREAHHAEIRRQIESIWHTDEIRRVKPTPLKEARQGLNVIESSLWEAVPACLRRIDAELERSPIGKPLPPDVTLFRFGSWMGGDRDGNPNVTPTITKQVSMEARLLGATLVRKSLMELNRELSIGPDRATPEFLALLPADQADSRQPYSVVMQSLATRIGLTIAALERELAAPSASPALLSSAPGGDGVAQGPLTDTRDLLDVLMLAHASLVDRGLRQVADGGLLDLIRQLSCFGLCLLPLDIRQESTRHTEALDAITRFLGQGSFAQWDEDTRVTWLLKELNEKRPLLPRGGGGGAEDRFAELGPMFDPTVCDTLATFDTIADLPAEGLGAYVISMAKKASDVLAVRLLQKECGVQQPLRVVPLFETLDDLNNAPAVMAQLWSMPWYRGDTGGAQEVKL